MLYPCFIHAVSTPYVLMLKIIDSLQWCVTNYDKRGFVTELNPIFAPRND